MIVVLAVGGDERRVRPSEQHGRWLAGVRVPSLAHPGQGQRASYDPLKLQQHPCGDARTFRFIEHVRADGWGGRVQDAIVPAWRWCGAGCHPNRRTGEAVEAAGFRIVRLERHRLPPGMPMLAGIAVRP